MTLRDRWGISALQAHALPAWELDLLIGRLVGDGTLRLPGDDADPVLDEAPGHIANEDWGDDGP